MRSESSTAIEQKYFGLSWDGAAIDDLAVQSGLLIISAVLFIAIAAAIFRAFTRKDKNDS